MAPKNHAAKNPSLVPGSSQDIHISPPANLVAGSSQHTHQKFYDRPSRISTHQNFTTVLPGFLPIRILRQAFQDFYPSEFYDRPSRISTHQNFTTDLPGFLPIGILRQALQDFYPSEFYDRPSRISTHQNLRQALQHISVYHTLELYGLPGFLPIRILRQALQDFYPYEFYDRPSRISTNQNFTTGLPGFLPIRILRQARQVCGNSMTDVAKPRMVAYCGHC